MTNEKSVRKLLIADYNTYGYNVVILSNTKMQDIKNIRFPSLKKRWLRGLCDRQNKIIYLNSLLFSSSMPTAMLYHTFFHEIAHNKYDNETICDIIAKVRLIFKK